MNKCVSTVYPCSNDWPSTWHKISWFSKVWSGEILPSWYCSITNTCELRKNHDDHTGPPALLIMTFGTRAGIRPSSSSHSPEMLPVSPNCILDYFYSRHLNMDFTDTQHYWGRFLRLFSAPRLKRVNQNYSKSLFAASIHPLYRIYQVMVTRFCIPVTFDPCELQ